MTETVATTELTLEEQEQILMIAEGYIRDPADWTTGQWKCPVVGVDGNAVCDSNNRPKHQYCVEGAVNQATYDVVGEERALALGAVRYDPDTGALLFDNAPSAIYPTKLLGLDRIAFEMYAETMREESDSWLEFNEHQDYAMIFNDQAESWGDKDEGPMWKEHHQNVLAILRTGLRRIRKLKESA